MQVENNKTLTNLVAAFIIIAIIESLFGLISSYLVVPMLSKSGFDNVSGYYKVQGILYGLFHLINFILLLIIGIQLKHTTIRVLVFVYAILQLGWAFYPLFNLLIGRI